MPPTPPVCKPRGWLVRCPQPSGSPGSKQLGGLHLRPTLPLPGKGWLCAWLPHVLGTLQNAGKGCVPKNIPVGFECPVHGAYGRGEST